MERPPGPLRRAFAAARLLGLGVTMAVLRFSLRKARLDGWYRLRRRAPREGVTPGSLQHVEVIGDRAAVTFERAALEVCFLPDEVVRLTWTPGSLPAPYALAEDHRPGPTVEATGTAGGYDLVAGQLQVHVAADAATTVFDPDGRPCHRERPPERRGEAWSSSVALDPTAQVHGLGERAAPLDLRPGTYGLWNAEQSGSYGPRNDPLYLCVPVCLVVGAAGSHLVFWENHHRGRVVVGDDLACSFDGGALRTYVLPGRPDRALARYAELTGRAPLPPRWALGYHHCRWGYRTQAELEAVADGFRQRGLPLAALHLDIDHMDRYRVFTFDPERFPDVASLAEDVAADGGHLVAIVDPGVGADDDNPTYRDGAAAGLFCRRARGAKPEHGVAWPGRVAYPDFTNPATRSWWGSHYRRLLDAGIDGIWHDLCEPAAFAIGVEAAPPLGMRHDLEGRGGDHLEARNLYGLTMARAGYEALLAERPDHRPWLLSRSGWAGLQRYAWTWTGDAEATWEMLRMTVATVLNLGLSGIPYSGPDIGGFRGAPSPELYLRWLQLATFLGFCRTHCSFDTPPREPWNAAPGLEDEVAAWIRLRHRLVPYLYTLAWDASRSGAPLARPVWWPGAADADLLAVDDAFLLGESLLVAPVTADGARTRRVRLPAGSWFGCWDDGVVDGGAEVEVDAPLDRIPVFVRAGAVVPLEEDGQVVLHAWPDPATGSAEGHVYADAGDGYGPHRVDHVVVTVGGDGEAAVERTSEGEHPAGEEPTVVVHGHGTSTAIRL